MLLLQMVQAGIERLVNVSQIIDVRPAAAGKTNLLLVGQASIILFDNTYANTKATLAANGATVGVVLVP